MVLFPGLALVGLLAAAAAPDAALAAEPALGARIRALPLAARKAVPIPGVGVAIDAVYVEGAAARAGVRAGDVLVSLNGEAIPSPTVLGEVMARQRVGYEIRFTSWRDGQKVEGVGKLGVASEELARACAKGDAAGCAGLADLYLRGSGLERDPQRAARLFQQACDAGDAASCTTLGFMQLRMVSKPVHPGPAIGLYTKGCDGGDARGCALLGQAYEVGLAMRPDRDKAIVLYRKACDGGVGEGCSGLAGLHLKGVTPDAAAAIALYRDACDLWDAQGCFGLGQLQAGTQAAPPQTPPAGTP